MIREEDEGTEKKREGRGGERGERESGCSAVPPLPPPIPPPSPLPTPVEAFVLLLRHEGRKRKTSRERAWERKGETE